MYINFKINPSKMKPVFKLLYLLSHFGFIGCCLMLIFQEADAVQKKLYLSVLIFVTLNLVRLLHKTLEENQND